MWITGSDSGWTPEIVTAGFPEPLDSEGLAEAIIGGNDLENVQTLLRGYLASKATGLISRTLSIGGREPRGTGFLVGPGLLLTNHHVLPSSGYAAQCIVTMDDETPLIGDRLELQRFRITPDVYFASKALDFAFVSVESRNAEGKSLSSYGTLELIGTAGKAIKGEPVSIIQHASGEPKAIALRNSFVMGRVEEGIYYTADTMPGSSGAVVMNRDWQVVALHHRTVPHPTFREQFLANRGVRISSLLNYVDKECAAGKRDAVRVRDLIAAPGTDSGTTVANSGTGFASSEATPATDATSAQDVTDGAYMGLTMAETLMAIGRTDEPDLQLN